MNASVSSTMSDGTLKSERGGSQETVAACCIWRQCLLTARRRSGRLGSGCHAFAVSNKRVDKALPGVEPRLADGKLAAELQREGEGAVRT